jgi:predicted dehydrogenase
MINVAFIGVSHWHLPLYLNPVRALPDVRIVGVADPDPATAARVAADLGCESAEDYRDLIARVRPDFVFALGEHADMPAEAEYLIDAGVAFALEKPCGISGPEVTALADKAEKKGAFAAVPLVLRHSDLLTEIERRSADEGYTYLSFKLIGRPPDRYLTEGSAWMTERSAAGGGALINLGIHYIDLIACLGKSDDIEVLAATTSAAAWNLSIEDYALVTLRAGTTIGTVETGYLYPSSGAAYMDMHYSLRTPGHYYVARDSSHLEVSTSGGITETIDVGTTNISYYPRFCADVLRRFAASEKPVAGLREAARAMTILDDVYQAGGRR